MKRIANLFKKDSILGLKDVFIILELTSAVFVTLLLLFVIPAEIDTDPLVFIHDETRIMAGLAEEFNVGDIDDFLLDSREEVVAKLEENRSALGLVVSRGALPAYQVEFLTQPNIGENMNKNIEMEMADLFALLAPADVIGAYPEDVLAVVRIESLREGQRGALPLNKVVLPPIILLMVGMIGLFAMISLVGQERTDLTIRAYRVSPGGLWEFIISKHLVILLTGLCSFSILYLPVIGFTGYAASFLIVVLTIVIGSCLGVILGSFFKDPMAAVLWVLVLMMVLFLPAISLLFPVFSPAWLKYIPSYHTLFSLDAAMFPDDNGHIISQGAWILFSLNLFLFPISTIIFDKMVRKES